MSALADLAVSWSRVGLLGFGGGSSMVPLMHSECVDVRAWMSEDEFLDALALGARCRAPSPQEMSIYVGRRSRGWGRRSRSVPSWGRLTDHGVLASASSATGSAGRQGAMRAVRPVVVGLLF
jgi:hypothetical protein